MIVSIKLQPCITQNFSLRRKINQSVLPILWNYAEKNLLGLSQLLIHSLDVYRLDELLRITTHASLFGFSRVNQKMLATEFVNVYFDSDLSDLEHCIQALKNEE